jgi:hypothetical protein
MTLIKVKTGGVDDTTNLGRRNLIINGAMQVAQRGTSVASSSGSVVRCVDRYRCFTRGAGAATFSQTSTVPTGQGFANSLRVDVTTVDSSLDSNDYYFIDQKIEGQDLQQLAKGTSNAKSVTASFWVRATKTGTYILGLFDDDNDRHISKTYNISSADTWEYKTITFEGDTTGVLDNDNNASSTLRWFLGAGTSYTSGTLATSWTTGVAANQAVGQVNFFDSTSNDFYITGIQLEVGDTATPFEHRSYGEELALCQRYYEIINVMNGYFSTGQAYTTSQIGGANLNYRVTKRAIPTLTVPAAGNTAGTWGFVASSGSYATIGSHTLLSTVDFFRIEATGYGGISAGNASMIYSNGNTEAKADAEL